MRSFRGKILSFLERFFTWRNLFQEKCFVDFFSVLDIRLVWADEAALKTWAEKRRFVCRPTEPVEKTKKADWI